MFCLLGLGFLRVVSSVPSCTSWYPCKSINHPLFICRWGSGTYRDISSAYGVHEGTEDTTLRNASPNRQSWREHLILMPFFGLPKVVLGDSYWWVFISQSKLYNTPFPLKLSVTDGDLTAKTGLTMKRFTWNWLIIYPTSQKITPFTYKQTINVQYNI